MQGRDTEWNWRGGTLNGTGEVRHGEALGVGHGVELVLWDTEWNWRGETRSGIGGVGH